MAVLLVAACAGTGIGGADVNRLQTGTWGGEHVQLTVTKSGAHVEFDCATGDIPRPLTIDKNGRLDTEGVFGRERRGPIRLGEDPARQRARYVGHLTGKTLSFDVILVESKETAGRFTVARGAAAHVRKCR